MTGSDPSSSTIVLKCPYAGIKGHNPAACPLDMRDDLRLVEGVSRQHYTRYFTGAQSIFHVLNEFFQ